jgi:5-oxopent-3-ene-1,2,5-tricarboxylate decarboxylase / 2-hydroxyhepta-2,4-diene-1,7-dioate isomerase
MTGISGNIYGVVLNDTAEQASLGASLHEAPYGKPPQAPVIFMKPKVCLNPAFSPGSAAGSWRASTTLALMFARNASRLKKEDVLACVGATALAIDLSRPQPNYYRPAIAFRNGEGTLFVGDWAAPTYPDEIVLSVNGAKSHNWALSRLVRPIPVLISEISQFLTIQAGDVLMVGFAGDAPEVFPGQSLHVAAEGLSGASAIIGGAQA